MDRKTHWETVFQEKASDEVSWYQKHPALSLSLIHATGLGPESGVIDVGAGTATLLEALAAEGWSDLTALDMSGAALHTLRNRLAARGVPATLIESDVTCFQPARTWDLWHDRAVFHFLTEPLAREAYADALRQAVRPGGQAILATFAPDGPEKCSGLPVVRYDGPALVSALGAGISLIEERREIHVTPKGAEQRFAWFRLRLADGPDVLMAEDFCENEIKGRDPL